MYCKNCGNKLDDNAYICVNCGDLVNNNNIPSRIYRENKKNNSNVMGILSIIFSSLALLNVLNCLTTDISSVGMYTKMFDRIMYLFDFVGFSLIFMIIGFIMSLIYKNSTCSNVGLGLSLSTLFLILTEVMVVMLY